MSFKGFQVAVDGPVGSGKTTVARLTAEKTGFLYVDTGAMYRAVALYAVKNGVSLKNEEAVCGLLAHVDLSLNIVEGVQNIFLNGQNVTGDIRTEEVSMAASAVAKFKCVREMLVDLQRKIASDNNVIMDGRDIGTNVLPDAQVKIYLDANVDARAKRRLFELAAKDLPADFDDVLKELIVRDHDDITRTESPLIKADDAVLIDTSDMQIDQVVETITGMIRDRGGLGAGGLN